MLKEVVKRRNPGFNESYFGFRTFGNLLEEAANRGLLGFGRDEKSGAYVTRAQVRVAAPEIEVQSVPLPPEPNVAVDVENVPKIELVAEEQKAVTPRRRSGRRPRKESEAKPPVESALIIAPEVVALAETSAVVPANEKLVTEKPAKKRTPRTPRARQPKVAGESPA